MIWRGFLNDVGLLQCVTWPGRRFLIRCLIRIHALLFSPGTCMQEVHPILSTCITNVVKETAAVNPVRY